MGHRQNENCGSPENFLKQEAQAGAASVMDVLLLIEDAVALRKTREALVSLGVRPGKFLFLSFRPICFRWTTTPAIIH